VSTNSSRSSAAEALLGRYLDGNGSPIDDGPPLANPLPDLSAQVAAETAGAVPRQLESGIKVVDLYAPLVRGGIISLVAGAGVGKTVLMEELIQRVATRQGGCAVLASLDDDGFTKNDLVAELRSSGVERYVATVLGRRDEPAGTAERVGLLGLALAEDLCRNGREVLLFLDELTATPASVDRLLARQHGATAALTTFILQHKTPADHVPAGALGTLLCHRDGRIVFNRALGQQNIWPAIDPLQSSSRLLDERLVSAEHLRIADEARQLLQRTGVVAGASEANDLLYARARRTLLFQAQPFVVAEPYTAVPGEYVPLAETIRGFGELVAGKYDALPEDAFRFVGPIEQALAKVGSSVIGDRQSVTE
jgi:F-type H+-transporting ATPase subunit beta